MTRRGGWMGMAALAVLATAGSARAQEVNLATLDDGPSNRVHVRTGAEHGFVAGVGYSRAVSVLGRRLLLTGDLTVPWAEVDASDYRVRAGALVPIVGSRRWKLAGSLAPTLRGTRNDTGRMTSAGADLGLTGGFYARRWFAASELGFDWAMSTHVDHNARYRAVVFEGARDGWYRNPGGNFRAGLQAGASFGRHDLVLRLGALREAGGQAPLLPLYGTLTFDTRW